MGGGWVAVFHQGVIQQIDDPISLYEQPCNAFVAQFIGENNAFDEHVDRRRSRFQSRICR